MGWYFAPASENGKHCLICKKSIRGKDVSQEAFEKSDFVEERDQIYFSERGVKHLECVWRENEKQKKVLDNFFSKI